MTQKCCVHSHPAIIHFIRLFFHIHCLCLNGDNLYIEKDSTSVFRKLFCDRTVDCFHVNMTYIQA